MALIEFEPVNTVYKMYLVSLREGVFGRLGFSKKRIGHFFWYKELPEDARELTRQFVQNINRSQRFKKYEDERKNYLKKAFENN